jgi:hypothetical protein
MALRLSCIARTSDAAIKPTPRKIPKTAAATSSSK